MIEDARIIGRLGAANDYPVDDFTTLANGNGDLGLPGWPLLAAVLVDGLYLRITPAFAGDGERLFDDGLPGSKWRLALQETGELGELALVYERARV